MRIEAVQRIQGIQEIIVIIIVRIDQDRVRERNIKDLLLIADFIEQRKPKKKEEESLLNAEKHWKKEIADTVENLLVVNITNDNRLKTKLTYTPLKINDNHLVQELITISEIKREKVVKIDKKE
jgi:hypothetical protein